MKYLFSLIIYNKFNYHIRKYKEILETSVLLYKSILQTGFDYGEDQ